MHPFWNFWLLLIENYTQVISWLDFVSDKLKISALSKTDERKLLLKNKKGKRNKR